MLIGALAAVVLIAAPSGFTENATLNARAAYVAGKPVSIYCASSDAEWQTFLASVNVTAPLVNGVTLTAGSSETYLSYQACLPLLARLTRRPFSLLALGASLDVLAHESTHMKGELDEGVTECAAYRLVPDFMHDQWGFVRRNSTASRTVFNGARNYHRALPAVYRAVC